MKTPSLTSVLLVAVASLVSVQLFVVNSRMNSLAAGVRELVTQLSGPETVSVGDTFSPTEALTTAGNAVDLRFGSDAALVFFLSPQCQPCTESIPEFQALSQALASTLDVVGVSTAPSSELEAYASAYGFDFPIFSVSTEWAIDHHLVRTPTTMLLSPTGAVEAVWEGVLRPTRSTEIVRRTKSTVS